MKLAYLLIFTMIIASCGNNNMEIENAATLIKGELTTAYYELDEPGLTFKDMAEVQDLAFKKIQNKMKGKEMTYSLSALPGKVAIFINYNGMELKKNTNGPHK